MGPSAPSEQRQRERLLLLVSAGLLAAVLTADVLVSDQVVLIGLTISAPLFAAMTLSPVSTRWVAIATVSVAALSFVWDDSFPKWSYWVPLSVVTMASAFAVLMAAVRQRVAREARRLRLLAEVAEVAQAGRVVPDLAQGFADLLVRRVVDFCVIDLIGGDGTFERVGAALSCSPEHLNRLTGAIRQSGDTARPADIPARAVKVTRDDPLSSRLLAVDESVLAELGIEAILIVPLLGREHPSGAMVLGTRVVTIDASDADELEYFETLAGRIALALQNAALSQELSSTEQRLDVILANLDAAITVRDRHGRMVYANQAAADLLNVRDVHELKVLAPGVLMSRFDVCTEAGEPVDLAQLPGTRLLAGELAPPPLTVRNVVRSTGEERWLLNKASPVTDANGEILMAVNLIEDVTETKRNELAQRLLAKASRAVAEASDLPKTLQALAEAAVPGLADWAGVDLVDRADRIETVAVAHRDPDKVRLGWHLRTRWPVNPAGPDGLPAVIRTGEAQLVRKISDEMLIASAQDREHLEVLRAMGLNSTMIAPIQVGRRILGALSFVSSTSRLFDERDLQLACSLGLQAGVIINHAQVHAEQAHIAHTLQAGLIPDELPQVEGWSFSSVYRAAGLANEVGGDFFDVVEFNGGWAAIIGDVVGKGAKAASVTAIARHTLGAIITATGDVPYAFEILNRRLLHDAPERPQLCTIAAVVVEADGGITVLSAGHPLPLLKRGGDVRPLGTPGALLGFVENLQLTPTEIELQPEDQLVLYTDGVLDAVGADERFGEDRLRAALRTDTSSIGSGPARHILEMIEQFLVAEQTDDIAILTITRTPLTTPEVLGLGNLTG